MDLLPHQLEPALAIVHGRGTRILIADEVGLGKTVQAALIVAELTARGAASRVLVLTPAGLREQWVDEFASRFGLRVALFDMATAVRQRASLPVGVNPWSVEPFIVTSIDYIKRPEVRPAVQACRWDVVIVDEAHHAAIGTDRHDAVHALCSNAPYVVLLTATPHNGDPQAFTVAVPTRSARRRAHGVSQDSSANRPPSRAPNSSIARQTRPGRTPDARGPGRVCACRPPRTRWSRSVHMAGLVDAAKARAVERLCSAALRRTSPERADFSERRRLSPAHVAALRSCGRIRCRRRCAGVDNSGASRHAIRARAVVSSGTHRSARRWPGVQNRGARPPASPNRGTGHRLH